MKNLSAFTKASVKRLKANKTPEEILLWKALKRIPVFGTHFRQQVAIGPYIADFACLRAKLIIELDGSHHADGHQNAHDLKRKVFLEKEKFYVLRFWNNDVNTNLENVFETIQAYLGHSSETDLARSPPHPAMLDDPPPQGEGKKRCSVINPPLEGEGCSKAAGWGETITFNERQHNA